MRRLFRLVSCDGVSTVGWGVMEGLDTSGVELNVVGLNLCFDYPSLDKTNSVRYKLYSSCDDENP